jgi:hypothetical protein
MRAESSWRSTTRRMASCWTDRETGVGERDHAPPVLGAMTAKAAAARSRPAAAPGISDAHPVGAKSRPGTQRPSDAHPGCTSALLPVSRSWDGHWIDWPGSQSIQRSWAERLTTGEPVGSP